jgi:hypothetical protein
MRTLALVALLAASCSYSAETPAITVTVNASATIWGNSDHLWVVVTPNDSTVVTANCPTTLSVTPAANALCYRPSFQPGAISGSLELDIAQPSAATTSFQMQIFAYDRTETQTGTGSVNGTLPQPAAGYQVTLH